MLKLFTRAVAATSLAAVLLFPLFSRAHETEDPALKLARIHRLVENLQQAVQEFVASETEHLRSYNFDNGTNLVRAERSALGAALYKVLKAELELAQAPLECHGCEHENEVLKEEQQSFLKKRLKSMLDLYEERHHLAFQALRVAGYRHGRSGWPMAVTVAVTWPLYTVATEVLESVFLGPVHAVCNLFQVFYASAVFKISDLMGSAADLRRMDPEVSFFKKAQALDNVRGALKSYLRRAILPQMQSDAALSQEENLKKWGQREDAELWTRIARSPLWPDFATEVPPMISGERNFGGDRFAWDVRSLFDQSLTPMQRALRVDEITLIYQSFATLLNDKAMAVAEQSHMSRFQFFKVQSRLGRLSRIVDQLDVYMKTTVGLGKNLDQLRQSELLDLMRLLWDSYSAVSVTIDAPMESSRWAGEEAQDRRDHDLMNLQKRILSLGRDVRAFVVRPVLPIRWHRCLEMHL